MKSSLSSRLLDRMFSLIEDIPSSDRFIVRLSFFAVIIAIIWVAFAVNQHFSELTPTRGGSFTEGIIGTPRFVNPALAQTRADQDVTALIYSGLMKIGPNGTLENDMAESITTSEDGLVYNVMVRRDVIFHDGKPLTARDVVYTIRLIQDPDLKSPLRGNWSNVAIEEIDEYELNIVLEEPYAPFIENFTLGIMPAHAWGGLPVEQLPFSQLNTEPIGSGPFSIGTARRDTSGLITRYTLAAFRNNSFDSKIDTVDLVFFQNQEQLISAFTAGTIGATTYIDSKNIENIGGVDYQLINLPLPRTFGIFLNQNRSAMLRDHAAREALTIAIDREELIQTALAGYGVPMIGPTALPATTIHSTDSIDNAATTSPVEQAVQILEAGGWKKDEFGAWEKKIGQDIVNLRITLRTGNAPLFESLVSFIASQWRSIGVEVITEQFEQTGLIQSVIRPRDFEAVLFGLDMSRSYDLYPFWHSSQQDDPGLNIAQYANVEVDKLLETARTQQSVEDRQDTLLEASKIIMQEHPAIFLFQPTLTYLIRSELSIEHVDQIGRPADRFSNITEWHTKSDSLWPVFRNDM
jgi:peptide/nickel transport system substrate-binding protein